MMTEDRTVRSRTAQRRSRCKGGSRYVPECTLDVLCVVFLAAVFPLIGAALVVWGPWERSGAAPEAPDIPVTTVQQVQDQEPQEDGDGGTPWNLLLVNRQNPIPADLEPHLTELPGGEQVDARIYEPLMELLEAAREGNQGHLPEVVSGYRTWEKQQSLYDAKVEKYRGQGYSEEEARALAEEWAAPPGYSEHQAGLAVDLSGVVYDLYFWLQENSWRYGFVFRYPGDKSGITGIAEEVWHYRYVGVEAAEEMFERGLCLEEYVGEAEGEA